MLLSHASPPPHAQAERGEGIRPENSDKTVGHPRSSGGDVAGSVAAPPGRRGHSGGRRKDHPIRQGCRPIGDRGHRTGVWGDHARAKTGSRRPERSPRGHSPARGQTARSRVLIETMAHVSPMLCCALPIGVGTHTTHLVDIDVPVVERCVERLRLFQRSRVSHAPVSEPCPDGTRRTGKGAFERAERVISGRGTDDTPACGPGVRWRPSGGMSRICALRRQTSGFQSGGGVLRAQECACTMSPSSGGAGARRLAHFLAQAEDRLRRTAICVRERSGLLFLTSRTIGVPFCLHVLHAFLPRSRETSHTR
jgi:hypothetical protein